MSVHVLGNPHRDWVRGTERGTLILQLSLVTNAGDFKLLSRHAFDRLLELKESDPYLRGLAVWIGFTQVLIEYEREPRAAGSPHFPMFAKNHWKALVSGLTSFSFLPIYVILAAGLVGISLSVLLGLLGVVIALLGTGLVAASWLGLFLLFGFSTLLLAVGTVGIYVIRIYKDVRGRPQYIVRETIGFDSQHPKLPARSS